MMRFSNIMEQILEGRVKIYIGRVYLEEREWVASHFIDVDKDSCGNSWFYFKRIIHNFDDSGKFFIPEMEEASFQEELRALNRALAITCIKEDKEREFIEKMLKEAYPEALEIVVKELE